jgi:hypothetical protein
LTDPIAIKISGKDALGKAFQESTTAMSFDCYGCKYQSTHYLPKDSKVTMEILQSEPRSQGRMVQATVMWVERPKTYRDFYGVAIEFDLPGNVWGIESPPSDWFPIPGEEPPAPAAIEFRVEPIDESSMPESALESPLKSPLESPLATGKNSKAGVAIAEEVLVDCTVDMMTAWDAGDNPAQSKTVASQVPQAVTRSADDASDIEMLKKEMAAMRHQLDSVIRSVLQQSENRIMAALDESRKEIQVLGETVAASLESKTRNPGGKRKAKQAPPEIR